MQVRQGTSTNKRSGGTGLLERNRHLVALPNAPDYHLRDGGTGLFLEASKQVGDLLQHLRSDELTRILNKLFWVTRESEGGVGLGRERRKWRNREGGRVKREMTPNVLDVTP